MKVIKVFMIQFPFYCFLVMFESIIHLMPYSVFPNSTLLSYVQTEMETGHGLGFLAFLGFHLKLGKTNSNVHLLPS